MAFSDRIKEFEALNCNVSVSKDRTSNSLLCIAPQDESSLLAVTAVQDSVTESERKIHVL